jgi:hypothetical protein
VKFLRLILSTYALVCLLGAIGIYLLVNAIVIFVGALFERRYKSKKALDRGWKPTGERFIDQKTGKTIEVHFNPKTGERNYKPIV